MNRLSPSSLVRIAACLALTFSLSSVASADESTRYARKGPYMEWAASYSHFVSLEDELQKSGGSGLEVTDGMSGDIAIGYRLNKLVAVDGQFTYTGIGDVKRNRRTIAQFEHFALTVNGRVYALTGRIQPYAIGGIGFQSAEIETSSLPGVKHRSTGVAFRVGGGIDFYITERFALTTAATYLVGVGAVGDYDTLQGRAGAMFRF
jgi:opacity protein-like surface antigen